MNSLVEQLIIFILSSGYDSSPAVNKAYETVYTNKQTPTYAISAYASEEESVSVAPPPQRKLPAGAVAMPHMMALWGERIFVNLFICTFKIDF